MFGGQMQSQITTESNYVKRYALSLLRPERDRPHGPPTPSFVFPLDHSMGLKS
ncbi:hypothetical protein PENANT_c006G03409 [Penicillium antarcticum]|uniref:Uncharacterized protein n=1 Tax=Penicillium antarcticum TaxID=416450 RepID=A0A1V6QDU2_9EURO|nr:hypothetical protein PENANT_c006G03409 [Penicillium antarcticum]